MLGMLVQRKCVTGRGMSLQPSITHVAQQATRGGCYVQAFIDAMCLKKSKASRQIAMGHLNAYRLG
jgi:hypothetical protein